MTIEEQLADLKRVVEHGFRQHSPQPLTLSQTEACQLLGVTGPTFRKLEADGHITRLPTFESPRYSRTDLELLAAAA